VQIESGLTAARAEDRIGPYDEGAMLTATQTFRRAASQLPRFQEPATLLLSTPIAYAHKGAVAAFAFWYLCWSLTDYGKGRRRFQLRVTGESLAEV